MFRPDLLEISDEMKTYLMNTGYNFVNMLGLINVPKLPEYGHQSMTLMCRYCQKEYKKKKALRKHESRLHGQFDPNYSGQATSLDTSKSKEDYILNYTNLTLSLGLMYLNQKNSITMGDGERMMRINQILCLY